MMFIEPNEHIIPMESTVYPFSVDDLKMMEDVGIKTIYVTSAFYWDKVYKRGSPILNWSSSDIKVEKYLHTNLKIMLPFYYTMPRWFPASWYINNTVPNSRPDMVIPNYANEELRQAILTFAHEALEHYKDIRDIAHITYAIPAGGEFLWDDTLTHNYPASDEDIFKFVIGLQKLLVTQHNEVWSLFHNFLGNPLNWNNTHLSFLYQALVDEFPDTPIYSIQGPHFHVGKERIEENFQLLVKKYTEEYGIKFFVGPDYCEGLKINTEKAISQKVYGFLPAPLGEENFNATHTFMEQWMADAMKEANDKFRAICNG